MELFDSKPELIFTENERKEHRKQKWSNAQKAIEYFKSAGLSAELFLKSTSTPHLRVIDCIDYWPATERFYDREIFRWGVGFEALKEHVRSKPRPAHNQSKDTTNGGIIDLAEELAKLSTSVADLRNEIQDIHEETADIFAACLELREDINLETGERRLRDQGGKNSIGKN